MTRKNNLKLPRRLTILGGAALAAGATMPARAQLTIDMTRPTDLRSCACRLWPTSVAASQSWPCSFRGFFPRIARRFLLDWRRRITFDATAQLRHAGDVGERLGQVRARIEALFFAVKPQ